MIDELTVDFPQGVTALIGPNGAGKSTLLKLLAGLLRPRNGTIHVHCGQNRHDKSTSDADIGWMPQSIGTLRGLTVADQLRYVGWIRRVRRPEVDDVLATVGLHEQSMRSARELSGGQRRRLGLAQALLGVPGLLLLDEPTAGLDPIEQLRFRSAVRTVLTRPNAPSIVMTTHLMADVEDIADEVVLLHEGRARFRGRTHEFLSTGDRTGARRRGEFAFEALLEA